MSIKTDIANDFKSQIVRAIPKLSGKIFIAQKIDDQNALYEWVRLSYQPSVPNQGGGNTIDRITLLQIDYYIKKAKGKSVDGDKVRDAIVEAILYTNRPTWWLTEMIGESDEPEYGEKVTDEQFEGFQLVYEVHTTELITCKG